MKPLSLAQAAAQLNKTERQLRYLIQTGRLVAEKQKGRWLISPEALREHQDAAPRAKASQRLKREIETACSKPISSKPLASSTPPEAPKSTTKGKRYSLRDMKAFQIAQPLLQRAEATLGTEHQACQALRENLRQLALGCHRFDYKEKQRAYEAARDAASLAVCALYLEPTPKVADLAEQIEQELMAALVGLIRRLSRRSS